MESSGDNVIPPEKNSEQLGDNSNTVKTDKEYSNFGGGKVSALSGYCDDDDDDEYRLY